MRSRPMLGMQSQVLLPHLPPFSATLLVNIEVLSQVLAASRDELWSRLVPALHQKRAVCMGALRE